jgi:nitrate reductase gamma subunit
MSVLYALLFYVAFVLLVGGVGFKIYQYWNTPAPLKIPTTPAPITRSGVAFRIGREVVLFESLFKSNKWIWLFGYMFHAGLALVLIRHGRYFQEVGPVLKFLQPFGIYAGFVMVAGLLGLWARRIVVERIRYITGPSDHLILALLVGIGSSGLMMKFVKHTDIVAVKVFFQNVMRFNFGALDLPSDPVLMLHLFLVAVLMIIFPLSKLLHAPGIFFSPSRNQVDNPREKRHIAPWAAEMEK